MNKEFILEYAKLIVSNPKNIKIDYVEEGQYGGCELKLFVEQEDVGKLIGKDGKIVKAMKAFTTGCKAKDTKVCNITITSHEEA